MARSPRKKRRRGFRRPANLTDTPWTSQWLGTPTSPTYAAGTRPSISDMKRQALPKPAPPSARHRPPLWRTDASGLSWLEAFWGTVARTTGPGNRRCRTVRAPCRRRTRGAGHPADPALPARFGVAPRRLDQHLRRVRSGPPSVSRGTKPSVAGGGPNCVQQRRHLRARCRPPRRCQRSAREVLRQVRARCMDRGRALNRRARARGRPCGIGSAAG